MPGEATQVLAQFAATLNYDDLPQRVRDTARTCCSTRWPAPSPATRARKSPGRRLRRRAGAIARKQRHRRRPPVARRRDAAQRLSSITAITMCDVHRSTLTHSRRRWCRRRWRSPSATACRGRDLLVALAAGFEVTTRIGIGLDYPAFRTRGWHGPGVLGPFGAAAAVGRLRGFDADTMAQGVRARRQPGRRHVRRLGHADGEIPPVPRRAVGPDGGAARRAEIRRDARVPHRQGRRPLQHLRQRRQARGASPPISASAGSSSRSRCGCGRRRPRSQGMNTALFDLLEKHTIDPAAGQEAARALSQTVFDMHGMLAALQGQVRGADLRALHRRRDPARPRADARAVRAGALRRSEAAQAAAEQVEVLRRSVAERLQAVGRGRDGRRQEALGALRSPARIVREPADARADRGQVPHLCQGRAAGRGRRGGHRRGQPARGFGLGAQADGSAPPAATRERENARRDFLSSPLPACGERSDRRSAFTRSSTRIAVRVRGLSIDSGTPPHPGPLPQAGRGSGTSALNSRTSTAPWRSRPSTARCRSRCAWPNPAASARPGW